MSFTPLEPAAKFVSRTQLAYSVINRGRMAGKHKSKPILNLTLASEVVAKMRLKDGDFLRLESDLKAGLGRLLPVMNYGRAAKVVHTTVTGRAVWRISYSGAVQDCFPLVDSATPLRVMEVSATEGLVFELPKGGAQ